MKESNKKRVTGNICFSLGNREMSEKVSVKDLLDEKEPAAQGVCVCVCKAMSQKAKERKFLERGSCQLSNGTERSSKRTEKSLAWTT